MSDEKKRRFNSEILAAITRRHFFRECGTGLGTMALASLVNERLFAGAAETPESALAPRSPHFSPKVKNIIYLFMGTISSTCYAAFSLRKLTSCLQCIRTPEKKRTSFFGVLYPGDYLPSR